MIKIAHELPLQMLKYNNLHTDYDYVLAHHYENCEEYRNFFRQSDREMILDNSVFELGEAFSTDKYIDIINKLQPTWYIIPDAMSNYEKTLELFKNWEPIIKNLKGSRPMSVVQGSSAKERLKCFEYFMKAGITKIGITYDYDDWYRKEKEVARQRFITDLRERGWLQDVKIHLLGLHSLKEFDFMTNENEDCIDSIDTSHPICFAISERLRVYRRDLVGVKPSDKLETFFYANIHPAAETRAQLNMQLFKRYVEWGDFDLPRHLLKF